MEALSIPHGFSLAPLLLKMDSSKGVQTKITTKEIWYVFVLNYEVNEDI